MCKNKNSAMEMQCIDPQALRMQSERSTIWATSPNNYVFY